MRLVALSGARAVEVASGGGSGGGWYASAAFDGSRRFVEGKPSPQIALAALIVELVDGVECGGCGRPIRLRGEDLPGRCSFQTPPPGDCLWTLEGTDWHPGCDPDVAL